MNSTPSPNQCHYCHKICQTQRCSRCKRVYYCSKSCQKEDWKRSHRRVCVSSGTGASSSNGRSSSRLHHPVLNYSSILNSRTNNDVGDGEEEKRKVQMAAEELNRLLGDLSLDQMVEQFHRASDEMRLLQEKEKVPEKEGEEFSKEERKMEKNNMREDKGNYNLKVDKQTSTNTNGQPGSSTPTTATKRDDSIGDSKGELLEKKQPQLLYNNYKVEPWECIVEKLTFISTLIVTLVPSCLMDDDNDDCDSNDSARDKTVHPPPPSLPLLQDLKIIMVHGSNHHHEQVASTRPSSSSSSKHTTLMIHNTANRTILQQLNVPQQIISTYEEIQASLSLEDGVISMRLMYHDPHSSYLDNIAHDSNSTTQSSVKHLNQLSCRSCHQRLLMRNNQKKVKKSIDMGHYKNNYEDDDKGGGERPIIQNVYPLPVGYWDDITDYLTCFEGQPSIDFSSSSSNMVRKGAALEDDSLIVLNCNDLNHDHVCILAIEGYGQQDIHHGSGGVVGNVAESRDWQDVVSGATLTCTQCCSILGYATMPHPTNNNDDESSPSSSYRLYKHRLEAMACFKYNTIGSFLGKELVRYAESKAVFTFIVHDTGVQKEKDDDNVHGEKNSRSCLFIRLLSWNTMIARNGHANSHNDDDLDNFRRCVKVIYQQQEEQQQQQMETNSSNDNVNKEKKNGPWSSSSSSVMGDACCPPSFIPFATTNTNTNTNSQISTTTMIKNINLYLDSQEWNELHDLLHHASKFFPDSVSRTTVMLKLGNKQNGSSLSRGEAKLSFLSF